MIIEIKIGWWVALLLISIVLAIRAAKLDKLFDRQKQGGYFGSLNPCIHLVGAVLLILLIWLVYFATLYFAN